MNQFIAGRSYYATSACDHNCKYVITITGRTSKTVTYTRDGGANVRRARIQIDPHDGEYIQPERYSMAPIFRAKNEHREPPRLLPQ